jgi:uncharacterized RDD family membrane protein YckC
MDDILLDYESPRPASKFSRWLACFIDYLIYTLIVGCIVYFNHHHTINSFGINRELFSYIYAISIFAIPWFVILPAYETFNKGQTIGKAIFGIKVLNDDGSKLDLASSFVRHLFDVIDFLPFAGLVGLATAAGSKQAQRIGDRIAGTIVVEARG